MNRAVVSTRIWPVVPGRGHARELTVGATACSANLRFARAGAISPNGQKQLPSVLCRAVTVCPFADIRQHLSERRNRTTNRIAALRRAD
jgi:hypothetical protein